jgi:hypothetical protein
VTLCENVAKHRYTEVKKDEDAGGQRQTFVAKMGRNCVLIAERKEPERALGCNICMHGTKGRS